MESNRKESEEGKILARLPHITWSKQEQQRKRKMQVESEEQEKSEKLKQALSHSLTLAKIVL